MQCAHIHNWLYSLWLMLGVLVIPAHVFGNEQDSPSTKTEHSINVAVLAMRGESKAFQMWQPMADYLSRQIPGYHFNILPVSIDSISTAVQSGTADFVLTNPGLYAELEAKHGIFRIATLRNQRSGRAYTQFGALIISRSDREDISDLRSLKGKSFMAVHPKAFGGWWMAWREFEQAGINPQEDFSRLVFSGFPQDEIVLAVRNGRIDAGTVRTDTLERMVADGTINRKDFKIINPRSSPSFPFDHSTRLYPEWPFAATHKISNGIARQVAIALLSLQPDSPEAQISSSMGWTMPLDYQPMHELMETPHVSRHAEEWHVALKDIFREYRGWIITLSITIIGLAFTTLKLNWHLRQSKKHFEAEVQERKRAKTAELMQAERIRVLYEAASMPNQSLEQQIDEVLKLGCKALNMDVGKVAFIDTQNKTSTMLNVATSDKFKLEPGIVLKLDNTFCSIIVDKELPIFSMHHIGTSKYTNHPAYRKTKFESYIGCLIKNKNQRFWTISFSSLHSHPPFPDTDIDLIKLMGRWVTVILEQKQSQYALRKAKEEAETANRIKSEFLANMSHELRTPLNAIIGFSELLLDEMKNEEQTQYKKDVNAIYSSGKHLLALINNILDLSKVEANKMKINIDEIRLDSFVKEIVTIMAPAAGKNGNSIVITSLNKSEKFHTDQIKLRQVMLNLLSNAIKFTQDGTISIHYDWHIKGGTKYLRIKIHDTGIGISENDIPNLFKPFTQVDQAINRQYEGTGLGLTISRKFCEMLGGNILLESTLGKESTFTIFLPELTPMDILTLENTIETDMEV